MHGQDPVHWQDWGPEVLRLAQLDNKLIFVSSGYFACHWCHVMQRESYRHAAIAELLNRRFIPVKVDRELHPALDAQLITFVERTRGAAGWPLNVFLTPEGDPLAGVTYVPPDQFRDVLLRLVEAWAKDSDALKDLAQRAAQALSDEGAPPATQPEPKALGSLLSNEALRLGDEIEGGFGDRSRFPMIPQLQALLMLQEEQPEPRLGALLELTLDQMAGQGLRDHLGGGFFRYTVDPGWQVPHYEKMLYTNALMIQLYLQAARVLQRPAYLQVARDTVEFSLRELRAPNGGFIASLSAVDAQGVEGGAYLWTRDELRRLLTDEELEVVQARWRMHGTPPTEGGYLPVVDKTIPLVLESTLESARSKLMRARSKRALPRDHKELAAWNGLMLSALADAAKAFREPRYREAGQALRGFLITRLWDGERLSRAKGDTGPLGSAALEDYAYVARGLTDWARYAESPGDLRLASRLVDDAWTRFYVDGAWRSSDELVLPRQPGSPGIEDGPMPSPTAVLIRLSFEMAAELSRPDLGTRARQALELGLGPTAAQPFWYASHAVLLVSQAQPR